MSILLLTGAVAFLNHLSRLRNFDLGFRSHHVLLMVLNPLGEGYKREQLARPYQDLLARLEAIPNVRSASISGCTPIQGCGSSRYVMVDGVTEMPGERRLTAVSWVSPRYFETLGIPMLAGRDFDFRDAGRPRVAIINKAMTRHYFPNQSPIGKNIRVDRDSSTGGWHGDDQRYEVVGVVGNAKYVELRDAPTRTMYLNMFQENRFAHQFELRTSVSPASLATAARQAVREVLKTVQVTRVATLSEQVDAALVPERLVATVSGFFGALGAVIAGIGLYGLLSYSVARRTTEIGVRMALGATVADVSLLVLWDALMMVGGGLVIGVPLALWSRPLASRLVGDLEVDGFMPLIVSGGLILLLALLASCVPALRAARVDPVVALRQD